MRRPAEYITRGRVKLPVSKGAKGAGPVNYFLNAWVCGKDGTINSRHYHAQGSKIKLLSRFARRARFCKRWLPIDPRADAQNVRRNLIEFAIKNRCSLKGRV